MSYPLVFIDTNIFLDFYRARGSRDKLSILELIDDHHDRIITGDQVRMEFSKNRQRVILESVQGIKLGTSLSVPSILAEAKQTKEIAASQRQAEKWAKTLQSRLGKILRKPATFDPVYQCTHRLFENGSALNLTRDKKVRYTIRTLARKRFVLGYPPRKKDDNCIGDAINWEWAIQCAKDAKRNVVIVSRDTDYGVQHDGEMVINDWLAEEFRARVGKTRKVTLTDRLSEAMKLASVTVSSQARAAEDELIKEVEKQPIAHPFALLADETIYASDAMRRQMDAFFRQRVEMAASRSAGGGGSANLGLGLLSWPKPGETEKK